MRHSSRSVPLIEKKVKKTIPKPVPTRERAILVSRNTGGIGDMLMITPVIHQVKKDNPDIPIIVCTTPLYNRGVLFDILRNNPDVSKIITVEKLVYYEFVKSYNFNTQEELKYEKPGMTKNRIDTFAEIAGVELEDKKPVYVVNWQEKSWAKKWMEENIPSDRRRIIGMQTASTTARRDWPMEKQMLFALTVTNKWPVSVIFFNDGVMDLDPTKFPNIYKIVLPIRQSAALMNECEMLVLPDSGLLHLAGALGKRTISIFGSAHPDSRISYYPNVESIYLDYPCSPCVVSGQKVETNVGYKNVEDVHKGDFVLTHNGNYCEVKKVYKRKYAGNIVSIKHGYSTELLKITPDHPIFVKKFSKNQSAGWSRHKLFEWEKAENIKPKMRLLFPNPVLQDSNEKYIDFNPNTKNVKIIGDKLIDKKANEHQIYVNRFVEINEETCWLFGLYIAEGSYHHGCRWTLGKHESEKAESVKNILQKYFSQDLKVNIDLIIDKRPHKNGSVWSSLVVSFNNKIIGKKFFELFGSNALYKKIPSLLFNKQYSDKVFLGMFSGDGSIDKIGTHTYTTASLGLALQVRELIQNNGYYVSFNKRLRKDYNDEIPQTNPVYRVVWGNRKVSDKGMEVVVKSVGILPNQNVDVYNFDVGIDNSYTAGFAAVHNCWYERCDSKFKCMNDIAVDGVISKIEGKKVFEEKKEINRVMFLRMGGIGDLIVLGNALAEFKRINPNIKIVLATKTDHVGVLGGAPFIEKIIDIKDAYMHMGDVDKVIDLRYKVESPELGGTLPTEVYTCVNRVEVFESLVNVKAKEKKFYVNVEQDKIEKIKKLINYDPSFKYFAIQATCTSNTRTFPPEYIPDISNNFSAYGKVVLFGRTEFWRGRKVDINLKEICGENIINLMDKTGVGDLEEIISLADYVIAPDTSGVHIAAALNKPCLAVFGNIDPKTRTLDYPTVNALFPKGELDCIPCWDFINPCLHHDKIGAECMRLITPERIFQAGREWFKL